MASTRVRELTSDEEWDAAVPILRQLWRDAEESFVRSWRGEDDYLLFGLYAPLDGENDEPETSNGNESGDGSGDRSRTHAGDADRDDGDGRVSEATGTTAGRSLVAVAGVSVQRVLHHVRHAWIHDFVVDEPHRGAGYGTELLQFVEDWARDRDCEAVALATRLDNRTARAFYESAGMNRWGHVIETRL